MHENIPIFIEYFTININLFLKVERSNLLVDKNFQHQQYFTYDSVFQKIRLLFKISKKKNYGIT